MHNNHLCSIGLILAMFWVSPGHADDIYMQSGEIVKGLVVEEHDHSVLVSTADGESMLSRNKIAEIQYDEPAYNLMSYGFELRRKGKDADALVYFEKAYELNPELTQARRASQAIRSRFSASLADGPTQEVDIRQDVENAWRAHTTLDQEASKQKVDYAQLLWSRIGLRMKQEQGILTASKVRIGSEAFIKGLRPKDSLMHLEGASVLGWDVNKVVGEMLTPRYAEFSLAVQRDMKLPMQGDRSLARLGLSLEQTYQGIVISGIEPESVAEEQGFKVGDMILKVNDEITRYTPLKKVVDQIEHHGSKENVLNVQRLLHITRK